MHTNKLYLFYPATLIGWLISLVTRSPFCHAAIEVDGVLYDSSENRATFGVSTIDPSKRRHISLTFGGDLGGWLRYMQGKEYDWAGVLGWLFRADSKRRFYCFEAAWMALRHVGVVRGGLPTQLSGSDLLVLFSQYLQGGTGGEVASLALQILHTINYEHTTHATQWLSGRDGQKLAARIIHEAMVGTGTDTPLAALETMQTDKACLIAVEERIYQLLDPTGATTLEVVA